MKRILLLVFLCSVSLWTDAQALLGTTGLLHAPTADMQRDKTFLFGGNYLNTHPLSTHFRSSEVGYTFNYYINITIFPWLEVAYICTLVHADHGSTYFPEQSWGNSRIRTGLSVRVCVFGKKGGGRSGHRKSYSAWMIPLLMPIMAAVDWCLVIQAVPITTQHGIIWL